MQAHGVVTIGESLQFTDLQLAVLQSKINKFESLSALSPRYYRDSWACLASINRMVKDENVKKNLSVLRENPDKYYFGQNVLPFDLFRLEKLLEVYKLKGWDVCLDDYNVNLFDVEDILDNVRFELDSLIDYIITEYELGLKRNQLSFKRTADIAEWEK